MSTPLVHLLNMRLYEYAN